MSKPSSALRHRFLKHERKAYVPVTSSDSYEKESMLDSKLGGIPFTSRKHRWPICYGCRTKMQFFLQINSIHLPQGLNSHDAFGDGLLQFFYCTNERCKTVIKEGFEPFTKCHCVRIIDQIDLNLSNDLEKTAKKNSECQEDAFAFCCIIDWDELKDYPTSTEFQTLVSLRRNRLNDLDALYDEYNTVNAEKLLGWPLWVQGVDYPDCRICKKKMSFIFQIDSEGNYFDYMFGDCGCGHITQCREHRSELAFSWACC